MTCDALRQMQTGLYATPSAPFRGRAATTVTGTWLALDIRDRRHVPPQSLYGCVVCHDALVKTAARFWFLYNLKRCPFVLLVTCQQEACIKQVAESVGFLPT